MPLAAASDVDIAPVADLIATQVKAAKDKLGKPSPAQVDLAAAVTKIVVEDTMHGASSLSVTFLDQDWQLIDSGFFDADEDGKLDAIEVNYPDGSRYWWRLTQVHISRNGEVEMVLMERAAVFMMRHNGPVKFSRNSKTRAEAVKALTDTVKAGGGIELVSKQLHTDQPFAGETREDKARDRVEKDRERRHLKKGGINPDEKPKIQGVIANTFQIREVEKSLDVAAELKAPELAVLAMLCAGIGESGFKANSLNKQGYGGVFQGDVAAKTKVWAGRMDDTAGMARCFLLGGKGFQNGGAIAQANAHPDKSPGMIAADVEKSYPNAFLPTTAAAEHHYQQYIMEARNLLKLYGGGRGVSFGGTEYAQQFNFEVGGLDHWDENYYEAAVRWAGDVKWAFFFDGNTAYFDAETTLARAKPVAVIDRTDPDLLDWDPIAWDTREIATEFNLQLICDPMEFRAGEVFKLTGFGPASTGSTIKKPGCWLISESHRDAGDIFTSFTLKQPEKPLGEPRHEMAQRETPDEVGPNVDNKMRPDDIINKIAIPIADAVGVHKTVAQNNLDNSLHTHLGAASDHAGPANLKWAADFGIGPDIRKGGNPEGAAKGDRLAKALADKFGIPWDGSGIRSAEHGDFRYQLIWRYEDAQAGPHYNHVHFGVKRLSPDQDVRPGIVN